MPNLAAYIGGWLESTEGSRLQLLPPQRWTPVDPGFLHLCMLLCLPDGMQRCCPVLMLAWFYEIMPA